MRVSVIIPIYNAEETIEKCLQKLSECLVPDAEVILVDNHSTDNSLSICKDFKRRNSHRETHLIQEFKRGPSAARNSGAQIATGEWLLFTDSDCVPSRPWISDHITHFDDDTIGAVAGCIKPHLPTNLVQKSLALFTLPENKDEIIYDNADLTGGLYPAANLAVRKEVFNLVGGFNEGLRYGEDHELCYKIYKSGYRIKILKDAIVEHIHRKNMAAFLKQSFGFGTSHPYELRNLSGGRIIFQSPFININKVKVGKYVWVDFQQADKKILGVIILGFLWWPFYSLALIYFLHLCSFIYKKAKEKNIKVDIIELPPLASLLFFKSAAITMGRIIGSFRNRVFCF